VTAKPHVESVRDFRRGQIVAAARQIVAREGLEALTIAALEAELGFSRGVITYHFANKDEIVAAVFESAVAEIDEGVRAGVEAVGSLEEKVRAVLSGNVRGFLGRAEAVRVLLSFWGRMGVDRQARTLNAALYARYRARSTKLLKQAQVEGRAAAIDAKAMSAVMVGVVIGVVLQETFEPGAIDVDAVLEEATQTLVARLGGARAARGAPSRARARARRA
jgi:AcrR family transcriptional regulator